MAGNSSRCEPTVGRSPRLVHCRYPGQAELAGTGVPSRQRGIPGTANPELWYSSCTRPRTQLTSRLRGSARRCSRRWDRWPASPADRDRLRPAGDGSCRRHLQHRAAGYRQRHWLQLPAGIVQIEPCGVALAGPLIWLCPNRRDTRLTVRGGV
jgi:hypothetical protein